MTLGLSLKVSTGATLAFGVATVVFSLAGGWLADRVGRRAVMLLPRGLLVVIAVPAFAWIIHAPTATGVLGVTITLSAMAAFAGAGSIVGIPEALPRAVRSLAIARPCWSERESRD